MVRLGDRGTAVHGLLHERRAAQALAHAHRADALLPRPRLDGGDGRDAPGLPPTAGHAPPLRRRGPGGHLAQRGPEGRRARGGGRALPHPALEVVDPLRVPGQPVHAVPVPRRVEHLDVAARRREDRGAGQRVGRGLGPHRRRRRPRRRLPPHAGGHGVHAPRDRARGGRPGGGDLGAAGRDPQLPHPGAHEAQPSHRRLRPAGLRLQLHRTHRQPAGRGHGHPSSEPGGSVLMSAMAQMSMVMSLDKCIGCHTCSVTCKQAWTNRTGTEYVWFNNVETRRGLGYPRTYEDQEVWQGGWTLNRRGKLKLKAGGRAKKLATIFSNPKMPTIHDYYEPWTYEYDMLLSAPADSTHTPVARPKSLISGEPMAIEWSANWDDMLGGSTETMA